MTPTSYRPLAALGLVAALLVYIVGCSERADTPRTRWPARTRRPPTTANIPARQLEVIRRLADPRRGLADLGRAGRLPRAVRMHVGATRRPPPPLRPDPTHPRSEMAPGPDRSRQPDQGPGGGPRRVRTGQDQVHRRPEGAGVVEVRRARAERRGPQDRRRRGPRAVPQHGRTAQGRGRQRDRPGVRVDDPAEPPHLGGRGQDRDHVRHRPRRRRGAHGPGQGPAHGQGPRGRLSRRSWPTSRRTPASRSCWSRGPPNWRRRWPGNTPASTSSCRPRRSSSPPRRPRCSTTARPC